MEYKLNIFFVNGKELNIILKRDEFHKFLEKFPDNMPHWNENNSSGFGVPLYNILYYSFIEYTEEMKKADMERAEKLEEQAKEKAKEESKEKAKEKKD